MTTHFAGELHAEEMQIVTPRAPDSPLPARVEVTQPYIPAIRDEAPEFAKRLNPDPQPSEVASPDAPTTALPLGEVVQEQSLTAGSRPTPPASAGPKRRSLVRRVVRRIIGPDLLRKDAATKR